MIKIGYEDLVANALIALNSKYGIRKVSMEQLEDYREAVLEKLRENETESICFINRDVFGEFVEEYSNYFSIIEEDIHMNQGISYEDLRRDFCGYLDMSVLLAFRSEEAVESLGQYERLENKYELDELVEPEKVKIKSNSRKDIR